MIYGHLPAVVATFFIKHLIVFLVFHGDRKRVNLLAGSLARVVLGLVPSRPLRFLAGSTRVACFFSIVFFECVGFYVLLDLVCSDYFASNWLAGLCPMMPMSRS